MDSINAQLKGLAEETAANDNVLSGCRMKLSSRESLTKELSDKATQLAVDGRSMDSRIHMLSEMEKDYEGYSKAVKTVMRESQRGNIKGVHGPVANLIKADDECALAIEIALGAAAQNIVIDSQEDGRRAIEMLKRSDSGRATFLPVDTIRGNVMNDAPTRDPGFVGIAYDLVKFEPKYQNIVANLLGRTVVAESLGDAVRMSKANGNRLRIVTLDGQLINAGGSMTGGSTAKGTGIISRANELEKLRRQREKLKESEQTANERLAKAQRELAAVRYDLDIALDEQSQLRSKVSSLEAEKRATENSASQLQALLDSLSGDSETRRSAVQAAQRQIDTFQQRIEDKQTPWPRKSRPSRRRFRPSARASWSWRASAPRPSGKLRAAIRIYWIWSAAVPK
jgi:chromosome segregation protein